MLYIGMPKAEAYLKKDLKLLPKKVEAIVEPKKIRDFSKSGAYIPLSGDYAGYIAYVIILKKGVKR